MTGTRDFISHSSKDDPLVARLRDALHGQGVPVWTDSQFLSGGDRLKAAILEAIAEAQHLIVVLSPHSIASAWVKQEVTYGRRIEKARKGFKVIPILLDGMEPAAMPAWLGKEPSGIKMSSGPGGVHNSLPALLAALGKQLPADPDSAAKPDGAPVAELVLELTDPALDRSEGKHRAVAVATLTYLPPDGGEKPKSKRYRFLAPLGPIEAEDVAWYLERYSRWPSGPFQERARQIEQKLPQWGRLLYDALAAETARPVLEAWNAARDVERRFSVLVDQDLMDGSPEERKREAGEAATLLLGLPWELMHGEQDYLFQGPRGVQVRRRLPVRGTRPPLTTDPPIRVLLVSPRPEDDKASYIDHRASARPLVEALRPLGELVELALLSPPTFRALETELRRAHEADRPYHVVHFDGHGVYDKAHGLGALCFEHPDDAAKLDRRRGDVVSAEQLARVVNQYRVPLVFLDACETARSEQDPTASVAGRLLQGGVNSVVAMSHSVLVETARRFVAAFYLELMAGRRVGAAVLAGRRELKGDAFRGKVFTGPLHLEDWFVPVLFQEETDPQLIREVPPARVRAVLERQHQLSLGAVPHAPRHTFVGRSRDLLRAERLLERKPYVVLRGEGGEGKTTLAAELTRWLVSTGRARRAAFVSLEKCGAAKSVLYAVGDQLVPNYLSDAAQDEGMAWQLVERALNEQPTLLMLDNMESVLPPAPGSPAEAAFEPKVLEEILKLCERLGQIGRTRLIFTSRETMPAPFEQNHVPIGRLERQEAIELVGRVLGEGNLMPHTGDEGKSEEEIKQLVEAVNCHARGLVLLAGEVVASGVRSATGRLHELMASLQKKYPDDRERSLLASVELSLQRLPAATRQRVRPLGVFQGGGQVAVIAMVLGLDVKKDEEVALARELIGVGLSEMLPYNYLRLDPALGPALLNELSEQEREAARAAWAAAMEQLTSYLYQQRGKDPQLASTLTVLELPNLLAALEHLSPTADAARIIQMATSLEGLVASLGRPKALARAEKVRADAAQRLGGWTHARSTAGRAAVERLLDAGRHAEAVTIATSLLRQAEAAGEGAYEGAAYDIALSYFVLGRALEMGGDAERALAPLEEARKRSKTLADAGDQDALGMMSNSITEKADCLKDLGRLDEAAKAYEEAIEWGKRRNDPRNIAVNKGQLGTVRMLQNKYGEALTAYTEARQTFESLGEPGTVAKVWHQIGLVHRLARNYVAAEEAFQASLKIKVQMLNRSGEAATLNELGTLYNRMGRLESAVSFYRQAAAIYLVLKDLAKEGLTRSNLGDTLLNLKRYDEARQELQRAIECKKPYGHATQPWKTFGLMCDLERAVGNSHAATEARQQAVHAYLAFRRAGGESQTSSPRLAALVAQAVAAGEIDAAAAALAELLQRPDLPTYLKALIPALQAVLAGSRDPALAADPNLDYDDAAELLLLLEVLGTLPASPSS